MKTKNGHNLTYFLKVILVTLMVIQPVAPVWAAPQGEQVVSGSATFARQGDLTQIQTSQTAIINYTGFDILSQETVQFIQPDMTSRVLNRVQSLDPTQIDGSLLANGQVYITNPAGVFFGNGALVDVGAIYAAAGTMSNEDFLRGIDRFTDLSGAVVNEGNILAEMVGLVGQQVVNHGSILAEGGTVMLMSGDEVYLGKINDNLYVKFKAEGTGAAAEGTGVENTGTIKAAGGRVQLGAGDLYSLAIRTTGSIKAKEIGIDGASGKVAVSGELDASGSETGGTIAITGAKVGLTGADLDASGTNGGGTVLVGGDYQGQGELGNAQSSYVSADSRIQADATENGDGGKVVVWADEQTRFEGQISAQGGAAGGDGGFVEVSGKDTLIYNGVVDTRAPQGEMGTLLLDPTDIEVVATIDPLVETLNPADVDEFGDADIVPDPLQLFEPDTKVGVFALESTGAGSNVVLQATNNIAFNEPVNMAGLNSGITAQAGNTITVNQTITTQGGDISFSANDNGGGTATGSGSVQIGAAITTNGGAFESSGFNFVNTADINTTGATDGAITLNHSGTVTLSAALNGDIQTGTSSNVEITPTGRIQDGLDAVAAAGTVTVQAGTYDEQLLIEKGLILDGSGQTAVLQPTAAPAAGVYDLKINASDVTVQNFNLDFNGAADSRGGQGIVVSDLNGPAATNVRILNNAIETGDLGVSGGTAIQTGKNADVSDLLVEGNTIYGDADGMGEGIYIKSGPGTNIRINNNIMRGYLYSGVSIEASNVSVTNNDIYSNAVQGLYGIRMIDPDGGNTFSNVTLGTAGNGNTLDNFQYGIRVGELSDKGSTLTASVMGNTIQNTNTGIRALHGAVLTVQGNQFQSNGVHAQRDAGTLDILATLTQNDYDAASAVETAGGAMLNTIWSSIGDGIAGATGGAGETVHVRDRDNITNEVIDTNKELAAINFWDDIELANTLDLNSDVTLSSQNNNAITLNQVDDTGIVDNSLSVLTGTGAITLKDTVEALGGLTLTGGAIIVDGKVDSDGAVAILGSDKVTINDAIDPVTVSVGSEDDIEVAATITADNLILVTAGTDDTGNVTVTATGELKTTNPGSTINVTAGTTDSVAGDAKISLAGKVEAGTQATLTAHGGAIEDDGTATVKVSAANVSMTAETSIGAAGAGGAIDTAADTVLLAEAKGGGIYLQEADAVTLNTVTATGGDVDIASGGGAGQAITVNTITATGNKLTLNATGSILDGAIGGSEIGAATVNLTAGGAIGAAGAELDTNVSTVELAQANGGGVFLREADAVTLETVTATGGDVDIANGGADQAITVGSVTTLANKITLHASGSILEDGVAGSSLQATSLNLTAGGAIGAAGAELDTDVINVELAQANDGGVYLREADAVTLETVLATGGDVDIASGGGATEDMVVESITAAPNPGQPHPTITLKTDGSMVDGDNSKTIKGENVVLEAGGAIGSLISDIDTEADTLSAQATGTIHINNIGDVTVTKAEASVDGDVILRTTGNMVAEEVTANGVFKNVNLKAIKAMGTGGNIEVHSVTSPMTAFITADGAITDDGIAATKIKAVLAQMTTQDGGIGVDGTELDTEIGYIDALSKGGGIYLSEWDGLTISKLWANDGNADAKIINANEKGIGLGGAVIVDGLNIANADLMNIKAQTLTLVTENTGSIRVDGIVDGDDATIGGMDLWAGDLIVFENNASTINALTATAGSKIDADVSLVIDVGDLVFNSPFDAAANLEAAGAMTLKGAGTLDGGVNQALIAGGVLTAEQTLTKPAASAGDLALTGSQVILSDDVSVGAGGLTVTGPTDAEGNLTAFNGITLNNLVNAIGGQPQAFDAGSGTLEAKSSITKNNSGGLTLSGQSGVTLAGPVDVQTGGLTVTDDVDAESNLQATGAVLLEGNGEQHLAGNVLGVGINIVGEVKADGTGDQSFNAQGGQLTAQKSISKTGGGLTLSGQSINLQGAGTSVSVTGGQLTATNSVDAAGDLRATGRINLQSSSSLGGDVIGNHITFGGTVTADGGGTQVFDASGGLLRANNTITKTSNGSLVLAGNGGIKLGSDVTVQAGGLTIRDDVDADGHLRATGKIDVTESAQLAKNVTGNDITFGGPVTANGSEAQVFDAVAGVLEATNTIVKNVQGGLTLSGLNGVKLADLVDVQTGDLTVTDAVDAEGTLQASGLVSLQNTATLAANVTGEGITFGNTVQADGSGQQTFDAGGETLLAAAEITKSDGLLVLSGSTVDLDGIGSSVAVTDGGLTVTGDVDAEGSLTADGSIRLEGASNAVGGDVISTGGNVTFASAATVDGGDQRLDAESGRLTANGTITKTTGGTLTLGGADEIRLLGNVTNDGKIILADAVTAANGTAQSIDAGSGDLDAQRITKTDVGMLTLSGEGGITLHDDVLGFDDLQLSHQVAAKGAAQRIDAGSGTLTADQTITKDTAGELTLGGDNQILLKGDLLTIDNITLENRVSAQGGDQRLDAGAGALSGSTIAKTTAGTLTVGADAGISLSGHVTNDGNITFEDNVTATGGQQTFAAGSGRLTAQSLTKTGTEEFVLSGDDGIYLSGDLLGVDDITVQNKVTATGGIQKLDAGAGTLSLTEVGKTAAGALQIGGDEAIEVSGDVKGFDDVTFMDDVTATGGVQTFDAGTGILVAPAISKGTVGELSLQAGTGLEISGNVTGIDDVTIGNTVNAIGTGEQTFEAGSGQLQGTTIQKDAGGALTLGGDAGIVMSGNVSGGDNVTLADDLRANGTTAQNLSSGGILTAEKITKDGTGDLNLQGTAGITLNDDAVVQAGALTVENAVTAAGNLVASSNVMLQDSANVAGQIDAGNNATLQGEATVQGDINAGADALLQGAATLGGNVSGGNNATLEQAVSLNGSGNQSLTANNRLEARQTIIKTSSGSVTLGGGAGIELDRTVDVQAGNLTVSNAVEVGENLLAKINLQLEDATTLVGIAEQQLKAEDGRLVTGSVTKTTGGAIRMTADEINLGGAASNTGRGIVLEPSHDGTAIQVGGTEGNQPGRLELSGDDLSQLQDGFSSITIGLDDGTGAVTVNNDGSNVVFTDPVTIQTDGAITVATRTVGQDNATLTLNGGGSGITLDAGLYTSGNDIQLHDSVVSGTDMVLDTTSLPEADGGRVVLSGSGAEGIRLEPTAFDEGTVVSGDDTARGAIVLNTAEVVSTGGDVQFGVDLTEAGDVPETASIYRTTEGALTIETHGGDFVMGQNQKISVVDGDLIIKTDGGHAVLGDLTANGKIVVDTGRGAGSPEGTITLLARDASELQVYDYDTLDGSTKEIVDVGLDFVARDSITFNRLDVILGGNSPIPQFASTNPGANTVPFGYINRQLSFFPLPSELIASMLSGEPALDLQALGASTANAADALAGVLEEQRPEVSVAPRLDPSQMDQLRQLNIMAKYQDTILEQGKAYTTYDDLDYVCKLIEEICLVSPSRISSNLTQEALDIYWPLFWEKVEGKWENKDKRALEIRTALQTDLDAYWKASGAKATAPFNPADFRRYLASEGTDSLRYLTRLQQLFSKIKALGITRHEFIPAMEGLLRDIGLRWGDEPISRNQLEELILGPENSDSLLTWSEIYHNLNQ